MPTPSAAPPLITIPAVTPTGAPAFDPIPLEDFLHALPIPERRVRRDVTLGGTRWRLLLPRESSIPGLPASRIEAALERLVAHRRSRTEVLPPVCFDPKPGLSGADALEEWRDRRAAELLEADLLLAGSAADLPFALQQFLALTLNVGRVSFETLEAYAGYADKVVEAETRTTRTTGRPLLPFAPAYDDATRLSRRWLIGPVLEGFAEKRPGWPVSPPVETIPRLLEAAGADPCPSVLLSASHGVEDPDPASPGNGALSDGSTFLTAQRLAAAERFLPDGVAILFACNSAGVSGARAGRPFPGWDSAERAAGRPDRVSSLATAMLEHPAGPQAVLGHVDLIYAVGLQDFRGGSSSAGRVPYQAMLEVLTRRHASYAGQALVGFRERVAGRYEPLREQLEARARREKVFTLEDDQDLALDWMSWHDARSWVLLGDPQARLEGGRPWPSEA